jgi:hypothetical protein
MLCFSTLLLHISLLFLNGTVPVVSDGTSRCLFDLGLGFINF